MITIPKDLILRIIYTLKQLDVRGFDSMDSLVGIVNLLESVIKENDAKSRENDAKEPKEGD